MKDLRVPSWLLPLCHTESGDIPLGPIPGVYPTHSGQQEDTLNEQTVRSGFSTPVIVGGSTEGFSAHSSLYDSINKDKLLPQLSTLIKDVLKQQDKDNDRLSPHAFKLPNRVTLTEQKREAWVTDLANPSVPIARLSKGVPHGYRGEKLLEMLVTRKVPVDRAAWYVQVVGASEIHNQKGRATANTAGFAQEWTAVLCDGLTKTLSEIPLPSTNMVLRPGMSIKSKGKSVLTDVEMRKRWLGRLAYIEALSILMYQQGLLSCSYLYNFIVEQLESAPLGLLGFIHNFAEPYIHEASAQTGFLTRVAHACCSKLAALQKFTGSKDYLVESLQKTLIGIFYVNSLALVSLPIWTAHRNILLEALRSAEEDGLSDAIASIAARNRWLAVQQPNDGVDETLTNDYKSITILDTLPTSYDVNDACQQYFCIGNSAIRHQIFLLLDWAVNSTRSGPHRTYIASAFCSIAQSRIISHGLSFHTVLVNWLEEKNGKREQVNVDDLVQLFAELQQEKLYSYGAHLQWAISRGGTRLRQEKNTCFHARLLWELPINSGSDSALTQRRIIMGITAQEVLESGKRLSESRAALLAALPFLSSSGKQSDEPRCATAFQAIRGLANLEERYRLCHEWLNQAIEAANMNIMTVQEAGLVASVYMELSDYRSLAKFAALILRSQTTVFVTRLAVDLTVTLRHIWSPLQQLQTLAEALHAASNRLAAEQRSTKPAQTAYQKLFGSDPATTEDHLDLLNHTPAATLPELTILSNFSSDEEVSQVASQILSRTSGSSIWPACLSAVESSNVLAISQLLQELDTRMHDSLQETAKSSLQTVSATEPLHDLLLSLIDAGALSLKTVLLHYTLPNIQRGSAITSFLYQLFNLSSDDSPGQEDHRDLSRLGLQPRLRELFFDEAGIQLVCDMLADLCTTDEQNYERFVKAFCASALWRSAIDRHSYLLMDRCALQAEVLLTNQFAALPQDCAAPWCFNELRMSMLCQAFLDPDLSPEESVEQIQKTLKGWISLTGYELVVRDLVKGSSPGQIQLFCKALMGNLLEALSAFSDTDRTEQQMLDDYMRIERFAIAISTSIPPHDQLASAKYEALLAAWKSCAAYLLDCLSSSSSDSNCILPPVILGSLRLMLRCTTTFKDDPDAATSVVGIVAKLLLHGSNDQLPTEAATVDNLEDLLVALLTNAEPAMQEASAWMGQIPLPIQQRIRHRVLLHYSKPADIYTIDNIREGLTSNKAQEVEPWHMLNLPNQLLTSTKDAMPWASNAGAANLSLFQVKAIEAPCRAAAVVEVADSSDGEPQSSFASEQATERLSVWQEASNHARPNLPTSSNETAPAMNDRPDNGNKEVIAVSDGEDEEVPLAVQKPSSKSKKRKEPSTSDIEVLIPKVDVPAPKKVKSRK